MDIKCTQCGAGVPITEDAAFIRCPFCDTALYVETDRTVTHYYLPAQAPVNDLPLYLRRKLAGFEVKDEVAVKGVTLVFFPYWRFDLATGKSHCLPAAAAPFEDLHRLKMPAGDLKLFDPPKLEPHRVIEPQVLLVDAALEVKTELANEAAQFTASSLVHLPLYFVGYACQGKDFRAVVDAVAGEVYADDWPPGPQREKDRALGLIALLAVGLFLFEAALIPGLWLTLAAYALTALGLYYLARGVLQRMGW
jgi:hypothetical protein